MSDACLRERPKDISGSQAARPLAQLREPASSQAPHGLWLSSACRGLYSPHTNPDGSAASPANTGLAWLALEGEGLRSTAQKRTALLKGHMEGVGAPPAQRQI